jgi:hypothetical protein
MVKENGIAFNGGDHRDCGFTFCQWPEPNRLIIEINLENPDDKFWNFNVENDEKEIGPFKLLGQKFRIAWSLSLGGEVKYVLNSN